MLKRDSTGKLTAPAGKSNSNKLCRNTSTSVKAKFPEALRKAFNQLYELQRVVGLLRMSNFLFEIDESIPGRVEILFPMIDTRSEANCNENWRTRHARHKRQKAQVSIAMHNIKGEFTIPCCVTFTRMAPRLIDSDNNVSAFKYFRDMVAAELTGDFRPGRADNNPQIDWHYQQEKAKQKGAKILFEF